MFLVDKLEREWIPASSAGKWAVFYWFVKSWLSTYITLREDPCSAQFFFFEIYIFSTDRLGVALGMSIYFDG